MDLSLIDLGGALVAIIAGLGAWAAQRSAAKASKTNTTVSGRLEAEREAYERARSFDTQTIERQDAELTRLRDANESLRRELETVKKRVRHLEENIHPELERLLNERIKEFPDTNDHQ